MQDTTRLTISPGFRRVLLWLALGNCLVGVMRVVGSFQAPDIYRKDFISVYLLANATRHGINPYLPLPTLTEKWLGYANYHSLRHPSPHPPLVALGGLPLSWLSYESAAVVWLMFELFCLLASLWLLLRWWQPPVTKKRLAILSLMLLGWAPLVEDLWYGQFSTSLLLLLLGAWWALRQGKDALGGALLGGMVALKLTAWPIVLFLLVRRCWRGVLSAGAVAALANLLAVAVLGWDCVRDYYLKIGPSVGALYRLHDTNYSTWTIGQRLFADFGYNLSLSSPWPSPFLAQLTTVLIPLAVLAGALWLARKATHFDTAFALLTGVSILVSPIAWTHYLLLAVVPLAVLLRRLQTEGWPRRESYAAFCCTLLFSLPVTMYSNLSVLFARGATADGTPIVPFAAGWFTLMPGIALSGLLYLLWRTERQRAPQPAAAHKNFSELYAKAI